MLLNYIIMGIVFAAFIEYAKDWVVGKYPSLYNFESLDIWMRVFMVILWPLCLLVFSIGFCKTYFKK